MKNKISIILISLFTQFSCTKEEVILEPLPDKTFSGENTLECYITTKTYSGIFSAINVEVFYSVELGKIEVTAQDISQREINFITQGTSVDTNHPMKVWGTHTFFEDPFSHNYYLKDGSHGTVYFTKIDYFSGIISGNFKASLSSEGLNLPKKMEITKGQFDISY